MLKAHFKGIPIRGVVPAPSRRNKANSARSNESQKLIDCCLNCTNPDCDKGLCEYIKLVKNEVK